MNALWWWIDRWRKSTAFTDMTLAEQGAYRNLLDEATLRGGALPNDDRVLAKASGDARAWGKLRAVVMARFYLREDGWHNETLDGVLYQSERRKKNQANYRARHDNGTDNGGSNGVDNGSGIKPDNKPASPDPDLSIRVPPKPPAARGVARIRRSRAAPTRHVTVGEAQRQQMREVDRLVASGMDRLVATRQVFK